MNMLDGSNLPQCVFHFCLIQSIPLCKSLLRAVEMEFSLLREVLCMDRSGADDLRVNCLRRAAVNHAPERIAIRGGEVAQDIRFAVGVTAEKQQIQILLLQRPKQSGLPGPVRKKRGV